MIKKGILIFLLWILAISWLVVWGTAREASQETTKTEEPLYKCQIPIFTSVDNTVVIRCKDLEVELKSIGEL